MEVLSSYRALFLSWREKGIEAVSFYTGIGAEWLPLITWAIVIYLLIFFLLIPLHKKIKKQGQEIQKDMVATIDQMVYLLNKEQASISKKGEKKLPGNLSLALMKTIFSKTGYSYLNGTQLIFEAMKKVEQLLGKQVISEEQYADYALLEKKRKKNHLLELCLRIFLAIVTFGIYLLFV